MQFRIDNQVRANYRYDFSCGPRPILRWPTVR
jgi:hypothetical protein